MSSVRDHRIYQAIEDFHESLQRRVFDVAKTKAGQIALTTIRLEQLSAAISDIEASTMLDCFVSDLKSDALQVQCAIENAFYYTPGLNEVAEKVTTRVLQLEEIARGKGEIHPLHHSETREAVWKLTGGYCAYCDGPLEPNGKDGSSFCIEHVVPRSAGGPDNLANYVPSCHSCNSSKNGSHVIDFINRRFPNRQVAAAPPPRPVALIAQAPSTPEAALALFVEAA